MINTKEILRKKLLEHTKRKEVGGVLIKSTETNKVLLLLRNDKVPIWSLMSGHIEDGESIIEGLLREIKEELSIDGKQITFKFIGKEITPDKKFNFNYYEGTVKDEFKPKLDHENLEYKWCSSDGLPTPLFPRLKEKIENIFKNK